MSEVFCKGCGVAFKHAEDYPRGVHENGECWAMYEHSLLLAVADAAEDAVADRHGALGRLRDALAEWRRVTPHDREKTR